MEGRSTKVSALREYIGSEWFCGIMATSNMILNYIKNFYSNCDWNEQNIQALISKHLLSAQVCFASGGSGTFINTCVVETPPNNIGDTAITIDSQLFVQKNLRGDFTISITDKSGKTEKVGFTETSKIVAADAYTEYEYIDGLIDSYDENNTAYGPENQYNGEQAFDKVSVSSSKYQQARVRFFIHPDKKDEIQKIIGEKKIPEGLIGEPKAYYVEAMFNGGMTIMGDGTWPYFPPQYADGRALNAENYAKACRIMWYFEVGNCDVTPQSLVAGVSRTVDNAGINFGPFQTNRERY